MNGSDTSVVGLRPTRMALLVDDEGGFTTLATAVAMLVVLALLFSAAQVWWVDAHAADIQFAADAGALAGENVVAEYVVVAQVADAVVLSLSLTGTTLMAVGAVAACIPYVDTIAPQVIRVARQTLETRDDFSDRATESLNRMQRALPFLCALNATVTIEKNGDESGIGARYTGLVVPVPLEGEELASQRDEEASELSDKVEGSHEQVTEASIEAEESRREMDAAKLEGYLADCGESVCMRERAAVLAGLGGADNPVCHTIDTWGFELPIQRANSYYRARLAGERPASDGIEEQVRSVARSRFYRYAQQEVSRNRVSVDADGVKTVEMAILPRNTDDIRGTELYTETVYPVSNEAAGPTLHATAACPGCHAVAGTASVADEEAGRVQACAVCQFTAVTLGKVPAASTSIDNGFEHYYLRVAEAARRYSEAARVNHDRTTLAKDETGSSLDAYGRALSSLDGKRIEVRPPGRFGCVAVVVDSSVHDAPDELSPFVSRAARIPPRLAISAAMLAPDTPEEGANVISSFLAGIEGSAGGGQTGLLGEACRLWGDLLYAYADGTEGAVRDISGFLSSMPLVGDDELSAWAEARMLETLELLDIQPPDLSSYKPVTVNTAHVLEADDGAAARGVLRLKEGYTSLGGEGSGSLVGGLAAIVGGQASEALESRYTIAHLSLFDGLVERDVEVALPADLVSRGQEAIARFEEQAEDLSPFVDGGRRWE